MEVVIQPMNLFESEICVDCGKSCHLGSGRGFNRYAVYTDEYEGMGMSEEAAEETARGMAEAAQNIVKHAYNGQPTNDKMKVEIIFENNQLTINLFDKGSPAIPQNIKPRKIDDIKAGGLGTFFIGQIMDEVIFKTSTSDWVNHLTLRKNY